MSNMNSFIGYQNLPAQTVTVATESPLLVPAQGLYGTLPSPTLPAGAGLFVGLTGDVIGNATYDGHPFTVRVAGKAFVAGTGTFTAFLKLGTSATPGNNTVLANATKVSGSVTAAAINFWLEAEFMWDSVSQSLTGVASGVVGGLLLAQTVITALPVLNPNATTPATLNFIPSFTFSAANAANTVTVTEFLIERGA
jgi:hypothetical protein